MIIDSLSQSSLYNSLNPLFAQAFDYIKSLDFSNLEPGKTVLVENELWVNVNDTSLKEKNDSKLEIHNRYIDIHIPVSTNEAYGWMERAQLESPIAPFDKEGDGQQFTDKAVTCFELTPGNFTIFFPEDAHAPCIGQGPIRKIIVKVKAV